MDDVRQIRVGQHMIGIIGLTSALDDVSARCRDMSDDHIAGELMKVLSRRNYIGPGRGDVYAEAFLREYKKHVGEPAAEGPEQGLRIKVLGPGCSRCEKLEQEVRRVLSETGIACDLEHVRDVAEIARFGVMGTPALIINGKVRAAGSVPSKAAIKAWIEQAAKKETG